MPPSEPQGPQLKVVSELITGLGDESLRVADYFTRFDWEGAPPDAEQLTAEDFLQALGR